MLPNIQPINNATRLNLQRLMMLRIVIMVSLSLVIIILRKAAIPLQVTPLLLSIGSLGLLNGLAWLHLRTKQHTHSITLFLQLLGDLTAFSFLFYFSGGYSNPFIWMYLLPITVAAVALSPSYTWFIACLSITCYTILIFFHVPLSHLHLHAGSAFNQAVPLDIHLIGMWLGFVVSAIIIAIFIARIGKNLRDYDQKIAQVREKALESERLLALGTQAASAAHELGTPLATMHIINQELIDDYANQQDLVSQLTIMDTQIMRCKEILSGMTEEAGHARANNIDAIHLKTFIAQAISRWQDTRPETELIVKIQDSQNNQDDPLIIVDSTLTRAILNVLDNAADESSAQIIFKATWDKKHVFITIRDFGKGLSDDTQAKLGSPFFPSKKNTGMGLGVYLTQMSLAKYEGELTLENHPEGGVNTMIKIPLAKLRFNAEIHRLS
jgi:two-component system sensor histidine kinase RegB